MADKLKMDLINSMPQPILVHYCGGDVWPLYDIDVETGVHRIDVCGKLQPKDFRDVTYLEDADGIKYDSDDIYVDEGSNV